MTATGPTDVVINRGRLLERFLRYVKVGTAADPHADTYPSSESQRELGKVLLSELTALGLSDAHQDDNALVWGTVPATDGGESPVVALVAHLDTSPEAPSTHVRPRVIESYDGGDIPLDSGESISTAATPSLKSLRVSRSSWNSPKRSSRILICPTARCGSC